MNSEWSLQQTYFSAQEFRASEGLFTQGNGYLHIRGSLEEHLSDCPQNVEYRRKPTNVTAEKFPNITSRWGTFIAGFMGKHPILNSQIVNLPYVLGLKIFHDGEALDMVHCEIASYSRQLNLRNGVLSRSFVWRTVSGPIITVRFERFISSTHKGIVVQRLKLSSDEDTNIQVQGGIDADVRTNGYDCFSEVFMESAGSNKVYCKVKVDGYSMGILSELISDSGDWEYYQFSKKNGLASIFELKKAIEIVIEKRTELKKIGLEKEDFLADFELEDLYSLTYENLLEEHTKQWDLKWRDSDICIENDPVSQLAIRTSIYHLLRTEVLEKGVSIDAKGYAGEAYYGRYFWDTEIYILPFYIYTHPMSAQKLLDFRINTLDGAKENARKYGYSGARYPWQTDIHGRECCANWQYADHEIHVTADIVYAILHYSKAVKSSYLNEASELIIETGKYWLSRISWSENNSTANLLGVMGPDEYTLVSNNNAYTNRMVKLNLELSAHISKLTGKNNREIKMFEEVAQKLPIPRKGDLILQCDEFETFAEPEFDKYWQDRSKPFASQVSQERLYRTKCLKQADVLMMMYLFPNDFTNQEVKKAWDYYYPYTTHDSSLSLSIHGFIALRLRMHEKAWEIWRKVSMLDLDIKNGSAAEGIHIASCGATWQLAVFGFAGMKTSLETDILTFDPILPKQWKSMSFRINWKGQKVFVRLYHDVCKIKNLSNGNIQVNVSGARGKLNADQEAVFQYRPDVEIEALEEVTR
ncbi:MAG: hypothetical protein A2Y10_06200 [Planctomycetes bacterium GWF2_41_51]|nr:MAG: hypothetical protein A2Y10_06200 [Planctomycetes bacterium GWF2_41_51]HBG26478.1 glycoside hydrolase family 65 protein [Phycisphaerales bacterium]